MGSTLITNYKTIGRGLPDWLLTEFGNAGLIFEMAHIANSFRQEPAERLFQFVFRDKDENGGNGKAAAS